MRAWLFFFSLAQRAKKVLSFLLAQMKELKKTSTPFKPPPIWGDLKKIAETADYFYVLVSRDTRGFFIGWRTDEFIERHMSSVRMSIKNVSW